MKKQINIDVHGHSIVEECFQATPVREDGGKVVQESSGGESGEWNKKLFENIKDKLSDIPT